MTANRGKYAEGLVRKELAKRAERSDFAFMRLPDARSGSFQPTTADFLVVHKGKANFVEVKEVDHLARLPSKNFSLDQRARLSVFEAAGANTWVLIYFTPGKYWRWLRANWFLTTTPSSWDFSAMPPDNLSDAVSEIFR